MNFTTFFVSSIISYFGLFAGIALLKIAPEEENPLFNLFKFIKISSVVLAFAFAAFYYYKNIVEFIALFGYALFILFFELKSHDEIKKLIINYAVLGVVFFLSSGNLGLFMIVGSLIFLYGTSSASMLSRERNLLLYGSIFILISNFLFTTSHF